LIKPTDLTGRYFISTAARLLNIFLAFYSHLTSIKWPYPINVMMLSKPYGLKCISFDNAQLRGKGEL